MEIEVTKSVQVKEKVNIEFPYYYKHDLLLDDADVVIFGKIEENKHTAIKVGDFYRNGTKEFELEIEDRHVSTLGCYMTKEYEGTAAEFIKAKAQMLKALEEV